MVANNMLQLHRRQHNRELLLFQVFYLLEKYLDLQKIIYCINFFKK